MTTREVSDIAGLTFGARSLVKGEFSPSAYLGALEESALFEDAIRFRAHELPLRSAVAWAAACVRDLRAAGVVPDSKSLEAAENWLKVPDDSTRWAARDAADKSGMSVPDDCVAMAVFFSGGSMSPPGAPEAPPPPQASQQFSAAAVRLAVLSVTPEKSKEPYRRALEISRKL